MEKEVYEFSIEGFSGPFDLILELAKQHEIEISEISLDLLIDQYLTFIEKVQESGLDVRSSYLEMAAELLRLKSASLLNYNQELELELEEEIAMDRSEMIRRILEYKRYKEIVPEFNKLISQRENYLTRGQDPMYEYRDDNFKSNFDIQRFYLATKTYLLHEQEKNDEKIIDVKELNVEKFIDFLKQMDKPLNFSELILKASKKQFVVMFLAILESLKLEYIHVDVDEQNIITIYPGVDNNE